MCDNDINQGQVDDWSIARRTFVLTGAAAAATFASAACAAESSVVERDVVVTTPDGKADAAFFHPAGEGRWPAVLIWADIMGLRPVFRDMARRLAADGYAVLVPNPFYRSAKAPVIDGAFDFGDPEGRKRLFGYRGAMSDTGIDKDAIAYLGWLDAQGQVDTGRKAGVQGYCMGGPMAFRTAAALPGRVAAVGSFHGGGLVTDQPASPHLLIPKARASWLVAIAQNDDAKEPDAQNVLTRAFADAKQPATVEVYPADHGWCVPGSQVYAEGPAERAWAELLKLYKRALA